MAEPQRKRKLTSRAKALQDDTGSEDELARMDSDAEELEEKVEFYTRDPKSPFAKLDLIAEYSKPEFQRLLTEEDKKELADLLPDHINLTAQGQLPDSFVRYNTDFRSAIRQFQTDLEGGRLDPTWLEQADAAMEERAQGKFDQWKNRHFEQFWGQKQEVDPKTLTGQTSTVKMHRLIEADLCQVGDQWCYSRVFGQGKKKVEVEKDFELTGVEGETLTFAIPSGNIKDGRRLTFDKDGVAMTNGYLSKQDIPDSLVNKSGAPQILPDLDNFLQVSVTTLAALEEKIVEIDGRCNGKVNGNAWKSIRVKRQEKDLGSLFDIREHGLGNEAD